MKTTHFIVIAGCLALAPFANSFQNGQKSLLTEKETRFVVETAMDYMLEVRLSNQVIMVSTSPKLQSIAKANVGAYTGMLINLKAFAQANKVDLPSQLDQQHVNTWNRISKLRGAELAQAYLNHTTQLEMQLGISFRFWNKHATSAQVKSWVRAQDSVLISKQ